MAWATWAAAGMFGLAPLAFNLPLGETTTIGMVLCTAAIILAAAATTQHIRALLCSFDRRVDEAHRLGRIRGRVEAEESAGLRPIR